MATTKSILKKKRQQAVVKFVADNGGSATLSMQELALADETIDFANVAAQVNINHIHFCVDNFAKVIRNGNVILVLSGDNSFNLSQESGFVINDDNGANITVDFGTANGTVILGLTKAGGYREPDQQSLQPRDR